MKKFESILEAVIKDIYKAQTLQEGKELMTKFVESSKIKDQDKTKMVRELNNIHCLTKLQIYATNAMFKYEGLSVNSVIYK